MPNSREGGHARADSGVNRQAGLGGDQRGKPTSQDRVIVDNEKRLPGQAGRFS